MFDADAEAAIFTARVLLDIGTASSNPIEYSGSNVNLCTPDFVTVEDTVSYCVCFINRVRTPVCHRVNLRSLFSNVIEKYQVDCDNFQRTC